MNLKIAERGGNRDDLINLAADAEQKSKKAFQTGRPEDHAEAAAACTAACTAFRGSGDTESGVGRAEHFAGKAEVHSEQAPGAGARGKGVPRWFPSSRESLKARAERLVGKVLAEARKERG